MQVIFAGVLGQYTLSPTTMARTVSSKKGAAFTVGEKRAKMAKTALKRKSGREGRRKMKVSGGGGGG